MRIPTYTPTMKWNPRNPWHYAAALQLAYTFNWKWGNIIWAKNDPPMKIN